jgi:hypothetical protein
MNLKITDLLDDYTGEKLYLDPVPVPSSTRIKEAAMKKLERKAVHPVRIALIVAAAAAVLTGTALGVMRYSKNTEKMAENWESRTSNEMAQEQKDFVEAHSADLGESVTDQGVTVTMESVTISGQTVTMLYSVVLDPDTYGAAEPLVKSLDAYVENPNYDDQPDMQCSTFQDADGLFQARWTFETLPADANLGDGQTTLHIQIDTIEYATEVQETQEVSGTWSFAISLPAVEAAQRRSFDTVLNFSGDVTLTITDIALTENGCTFNVETDNNDYIFTNSGEEADLAHAAEPDAPIFTVDAKLADGTTVPCIQAGMQYNSAADLDRWSITWAVPVDPEEVVSLVFSDGNTREEISMEAADSWTLDGEISLEIQDVSVDEDGIHFSVKSADNTQYQFSGAPDMAAEANPDKTICTAYGLLADGSIVPEGSAHMTYNTATGLDDWTISWAAPMDPAEVVSLVLSDGATEIEIPIN